MSRIAAGTTVSWSSTSGGVRTTKRGVVLGFLPAGMDVLEHCDHVTAKSRIMVSENTYVSSVDRYAVECRSASDLPVIYAPLASVVESQNQTTFRDGGVVDVESVLRAIDEIIKEYSRGQAEAMLADWDDAENAFYEGALQVAHRLRARFRSNIEDPSEWEES